MSRPYSTVQQVDLIKRTLRLKDNTIGLFDPLDGIREKDNRYRNQRIT